MKELENAIKWCEKRQNVKQNYLDTWPGNGLEHWQYRIQQGERDAFSETVDYLRSVLRRQKKRGER